MFKVGDSYATRCGEQATLIYVDLDFPLASTRRLVWKSSGTFYTTTSAGNVWADGRPNSSDVIARDYAWINVYEDKFGRLHFGPEIFETYGMAEKQNPIEGLTPVGRRCVQLVKGRWDPPPQNDYEEQ